MKIESAVNTVTKVASDIFIMKKMKFVKTGKKPYNQGIEKVIYQGFCNLWFRNSLIYPNIYIFSANFK